MDAMNELYQELLEAYSDKNLNRITGKLIDLYKNRNYSEIRNIANKISKYVVIDEEQDAKCFSKLIMLYHPDKGDYFRNHIRALFMENDLENLEKYAHIRMVEDIENIEVHEYDEDIDYQPEYMWDDQESDIYNAYHEEGDDDDGGMEPEEIEKSFYNAVKLREFGSLEVYFPTWYVRDLEEFEMEYAGITSLFGVEYCEHLIVLDLSNNEITDLTELWTLYRLEELYLANNEIGYIDALSNLSRLRVIDLSGNQIDDISPLFELKHLEYLNLMDNKIPQHQIEYLKKRDIIVMH
jgi:Leucine-rich repeat (LRR) protein